MHTCSWYAYLFVVSVRRPHATLPFLHPVVVVAESHRSDHTIEVELLPKLASRKSANIDKGDFRGEWRGMYTGIQTVLNDM